MGKRKDKSRSCEKFRHLERGTRLTDGRIPQSRLRLFGHVQRRDKDEATRKILQMGGDGKRNQGRPKLRWRDLVRKNSARNQMTTEMAEDRKHWHVMIQAHATKCRDGKVRRCEEMARSLSKLTILIHDISQV